MKPINGMSEIRAAGEGQERLPVGGYVVKILDVEEVVKDWGSWLQIGFDIIEGDYAGYYQTNYDMQQQEDKKWKGTYRMYIPKDNGTEMDGWTKSAFKRDYEAFEDSNQGFHWDWDESKLKGLVVGAIFHNKEYEFDGRTGFYTACHHFTSVERIRENKFRIPKDKLLDRAKMAAGAEDFQPIDELPEGELPF